MSHLIVFVICFAARSSRLDLLQNASSVQSHSVLFLELIQESSLFNLVLIKLAPQLKLFEGEPGTVDL